jgi:protein phosphatase
MNYLRKKRESYRFGRRRGQKLYSTNAIILLLLIPFQDITTYLIFAGIGALVGLLVLLVIILPILVLLRRRKKVIELAAPPPEEPQPEVAASEVDTKESFPALGIGEPVTSPVSGQRPAGVKWKIAGLTDVGLKRELNEDNLLLTEADTPNGLFGLYAVADGMGGHEKGEVASRLTLDTVQTEFTQTPPVVPFEEWLRNVVVAANGIVMARQDSGTPDKKMGSTLVMALFTEQDIHIANVGDSRAYHLTADSITQITEDHSLVERLVQIGQITREEARHHRQKNVIYNTIGDKENLQVSLYDLFLPPGDRLLLCSDGLNGMLTDEQILEISRTHPQPADACKELVQAAKNAGGLDNITAIVIDMDTPQETSQLDP